MLRQDLECRPDVRLAQIEAQTLYWDEKMSANAVYPNDESLNLEVGAMNAEAIVTAANRAAKAIGPFKRFSRSVLEFGPGNKLYAAAWVSQVASVGFFPRRIDVSKWVINEILPYVARENCELARQHGEDFIYATLTNSSVKHGEVENELYLPQNFHNVSVLSFARMISKFKAPMKRTVQAAGELLNPWYNTDRSRALVFVDVLRKDESEKDQPTLYQYECNLRRGAEHKINVEVFGTVVGSEKTYTCFIATLD